MGYATASTARVAVREAAARRRRGSADPVPADPAAPAPTDPAAPRDPAAVQKLGDRIAALAAEITTSKAELLSLIVEFHAARGWELEGHRDCAAWLGYRTGMDAVTAREHVRVALALRTLPRTTASMTSGALSFSKARAITRIAKPETEADLVALAETAPTESVERVVRAWKVNGRLEEAELERQRYLSRTCSIFPQGGMYVLTARLPAEDGAGLKRAIEEECDRSYRVARAAGEGQEEEDTRAAAARRRADTLVALIERGLSAPAPDDESAPVCGTRAERYQVVLHVEPESLAAEGEPGMSELEDGTRVSAETARRLACDAGVVRVTRDPETGSVLDVGRRSRSTPSAIRRALEVRDRGCRFPGCGLRYTQPHHLQHWADGGATSFKNSVLLCRRHHRLVHEGGWKIEMTDEDGARRVTFTDPQGRVHAGGRAPPQPALL